MRPSHSEPEPARNRLLGQRSRAAVRRPVPESATHPRIPPSRPSMRRRTPPPSALPPPSSPAMSPSVRIASMPCAPRWIPAPTRSILTPSPPPCSRTSSGAEHEAARHRSPALLRPSPANFRRSLANSMPCSCAIAEAIEALVAWDPAAFQSAVERQSAHLRAPRPSIAEWRNRPGATAAARKVRELNRVYDRLLQHSIQWTRTMQSILRGRRSYPPQPRLRALQGLIMGLTADLNVSVQSLLASTECHGCDHHQHRQPEHARLCPPTVELEESAPSRRRRQHHRSRCQSHSEHARHRPRPQHQRRHRAAESQQHRLQLACPGADRLLRYRLGLRRLHHRRLFQLSAAALHLSGRQLAARQRAHRRRQCRLRLPEHRIGHHPGPAASRPVRRPVHRTRQFPAAADCRHQRPDLHRPEPRPEHQHQTRTSSPAFSPSSPPS